MFAVCIEKKHAGLDLSSVLLGQFEARGIAGMPFENKVHFLGELGNEYQFLLLEQSIHDSEATQIESIDSLMIAGWLRLDNSTELHSRLNIANKLSDRQLILHAYLQWGEAFIEQLYGDFSFVLLDLQSQEFYLCRDHMGIRPLFYFQDDERVIASTSMAVIVNADVLPLDWSEEYITRYCSNIASRWILTPYQQILKLAPAHIAKLLVTQLNNHKENLKGIFDINIESYFQFDPDKQIKRESEKDYIDEYKFLLDQSIECRINDIAEKLACESSGGIDSSTLIGLSAKYIENHENNLLALGIVSEVEEESCIQMMSDFLDLEYTSLIKGDQLDFEFMQEAEKSFSDFSASPVVAHISTVHAPIYKKAFDQGAKVLLSGFGGDEFVTIYGATARVELYKKRQWEKWFSLFKGNFLTSKLRAFKWLMRFYSNRNTFETARSLLRLNKEFLKNSVIKKTLEEKYAIAKELTEKSSYDAGCQTVNEFSLNNRWSPDMVARLEDCSLAAASHGVEYRWPLLDVRLIIFFLSVPSELKLSNGIPRFLHRRAIQGVIPEHLIWKDKSMGGPIRSFDKKLDIDEINDMYKQANIEFKDLHQQIQNIIDPKLWHRNQELLTKLKENAINTKNVDGQDLKSLIEINEFQKQMMFITPILLINQWLSTFNLD